MWREDEEEEGGGGDMEGSYRGKRGLLGISHKWRGHTPKLFFFGVSP